jgi:hypothetical protein
MDVVKDDARAALAAAHAGRESAERELEGARAATGKGRALLERIIRQIEDHAAAEKCASSALADEMKASLRNGVALSITESDRDLRVAAAALGALEARRNAAEQVVAEFTVAEREAEASVEDARAAVGEAIRGVLRAEAAEIAAKWATCRGGSSGFAPQAWRAVWAGCAAWRLGRGFARDRRELQGAVGPRRESSDRCDLGISGGRSRSRSCGSLGFWRS